MDFPCWRCTCRAQGSGVWCKLLWPLLGGTVLFTEVHSADEWVENVSSCSIMPRAESSPCSLGSPSRRENNHLSDVRCFHQILAFTLLCVRCQSAFRIALFCFFSSAWLDFKTPSFRDHVAWTQADPLGEGLPVLWPM